jgi:hypothetical protein
MFHYKTRRNMAHSPVKAERLAEALIGSAVSRESLASGCGWKLAADLTTIPTPDNLQRQ